MNETSPFRGRHYPQLDALRGIAALMVVINHFVLVGPLRWIPRSPLRVLALGHEAVILFFILSGFVLTLQLISDRRITYRDYVIKRICRIYLPYLVVLFAAFSAIYLINIEPVKWAGSWFNHIWTGSFSGGEILEHLLFIGQYKANRVLPVIWSLIYEMRISLMMPLVVYCVRRVSARTCLAAALGISLVSFAFAMGRNTDVTSSPSFSGEWAMTAHYLGMFIVGATLAFHRVGWQQWLAKGDRTMLVLAASVTLYFLSRSIMSITSGILGQYIFDWCVVAGAAGITCTTIVSRRFTLALARRPIVFLGTISYSLYLTHTVVLLTVIHLMPASVPAWRSIMTAALLVIPVAAVTHFVVERPSIYLGKFLTGRSALASSRANQAS
ncbi:acyltransferase [Caballeronia sp. dw_19]|uniref:acyltransferase family protein n=1 Tax=Caballeronia sp. dw_19 TaxID=2719791 RepID=UPI0021072E94|nr:acyltransferase [Caballeronia sp. dw_19]